MPLVCGRASVSGEIEVCNAGHPPPLLICAGEVAGLDATGLPIGMFCTEHFSTRTVRLAPGDLLLLYTDGLLEAQNAAGVDYGAERLRGLAASAHWRPKAIIDACVHDVARFHGTAELADDLTILAISRS